MPLPAGGKAVWPPPVYACVYDRMRAWSAWYSGDADGLSAIYGGQYDTTGHQFFASESGRGVRVRVRSAIARWFWGTATPAHEQRTKLHVPIAGDIAATSADLLFSEPPTLAVDDQKTQGRLDELVDDGVHAALLEAAEIGAALGGVYLRVVWDKALADRPWLTAVHPDCAVPEFTWGRLSAVTFWRCIAEHDGGIVVRHLERHEPGAVLHGVYVGDADELGHRVPLTEYPDTRGLVADLVDGDRIPTGVDRLTAVYVPNMRPNRLWPSTPAAGYLGRSDYAGSEPLMDALDEVYSSWMRDIRLAKARIVVPNVYLESQGRGQGAVFESEREIYAGLEALPGDGGLEMTQVQFAIRVAEHQQSAQDLMAQILRRAGYAGQTFGLTGDAAITATEVAARERRSFITRDRKIVYWRGPLAEIIETLLAVDQAVFSSGLTPERPDISFGDSVSEDPRAVAETVNLLAQAQAASIETRVRMVHPDWDDTQVGEESARIRAQTGVTVEDPATFTGADPTAADPTMPPADEDEGDVARGDAL